MTRIEKGVPVSERSEVIAVLRRMRVGDSVVVKTVAEQWCFYANAKRCGIKLVMRKLERSGGWRVWRVRNLRRANAK